MRAAMARLASSRSPPAVRRASDENYVQNYKDDIMNNSAFDNVPDQLNPYTCKHDMLTAHTRCLFGSNGAKREGFEEKFALSCHFFGSWFADD